MFLRTAILVGLAARSALADPSVTLRKNKVTYRGTAAGGVEHFQNIRYAHDTSGQRRFAPPEPYSSPEGAEVDASAPGPACPQSKAAMPPYFVEIPEISEDCLNLRIARPAGTAEGDNLPVVVHLHGGGVVKGSAYDPHFDPDKLITLSKSLSKPIIYVALNYRLTIFGFARLPILKEQKSLNNGIRDQRAGLQWVKDNIAAFGGDPDRITLFGLSAGGTATSLHLVSYGGEKGVPFTRAWAMSGPPGTALNMSSDVSELHTRNVAAMVGCGDEVEDAKLLECLRNVPFEELTKKAMEYSVSNHPPGGLFTFIPSIDGDFFPERQSVLYRSGRFVKGIPLVYGWTIDDGDLNAGPAQLYETEDSIKATIRNFAHALTDDDFARLFALYPAADFAEQAANYEARRDAAAGDPAVPVHYFRASRILRDLLFTCSSLDFGRAMAAASSAAAAGGGGGGGVRVYALNQTMLTPVFRAVGMPYVGVAHGSDTNYIFNGVFPEGGGQSLSPADERLAAAMAGSFIRFAYTGNPAGEDGEDASLGPWPEAFPAGPEGGQQDGVEILVVGGPLGTGSVRLAGQAAAREGAGGSEEGMQIPIVGADGSLEVREMGTKEAAERQRLLEAERLLERCEFINSLTEKIGI
ncbi:71117122-090b-44f1-9b5e-52a02fb6a7c1 [Thermothielavioides terrestris]|uniref:Carboxylic ester hydrolase n=1 Tax=Thermothielavioides terrestris TaxID=2587410 RepID=A0A446BG43_9PEZI|nr:71117122-090b-44f1-9b5e-52a02fb6a7c1 [Thermothielavioides terrestris]